MAVSSEHHRLVNMNCDNVFVHKETDMPPDCVRVGTTSIQDRFVGLPAKAPMVFLSSYNSFEILDEEEVSSSLHIPKNRLHEQTICTYCYQQADNVGHISTVSSITSLTKKLEFLSINSPTNTDVFANKSPHRNVNEGSFSVDENTYKIKAISIASVNEAECHNLIQKILQREQKVKMLDATFIRSFGTFTVDSSPEEVKFKTLVIQIKNDIVEHHKNINCGLAKGILKVSCPKYVAQKLLFDKLIMWWEEMHDCIEFLLDNYEYYQCDHLLHLQSVDLFGKHQNTLRYILFQLNHHQEIDTTRYSSCLRTDKIELRLRRKYEGRKYLYEIDRFNI